MRAMSKFEGGFLSNLIRPSNFHRRWENRGELRTRTAQCSEYFDVSSYETIISNRLTRPVRYGANQTQIIKMGLARDVPKQDANVW
jgi:hypothetical protein